MADGPIEKGREDVIGEATSSEATQGGLAGGRENGASRNRATGEGAFLSQGEQLNQGEQQLHGRGVNAYEAIRQADEKVEAALAEDRAAFAKQPHAFGTMPASAISPDAISPNAVPTSPVSASPVPIGSTSINPAPFSEAVYSGPRQHISRSAAQRSQDNNSENHEARTTPPPSPASRLSKRWPWQKESSEETSQENAAPELAPDASPEGRYVVNPADGSLIFVPTQAQPPIWWKQQPYYAIAHLLAVSGTFMGAWLFGILIGQILPGNFAKPPLQEAVLRKSSRLAHSLWHFPQLWQSPTTETRIEAIPIPDTGPVVKSISLSPIERQPLIDELNAIETEVLTLDRRIQILEKQLGRPPYEGADIDQRLNSLRAAIDPPVNVPVKANYTPEPIDPSDRLLEVAERKITLPADMLFTPGQSAIKSNAIKETDVLNQVLDQLVNYPGATVVVSSYSDNQAGAAASRKYTLAQANALSQYLQSALPEAYRWITIGGGETQAVTSNGTVPGRQRNRRIEILIDTR
ncbi:MAG: OmpA family protein [Phormidesmis sp.]